jgi:intracellular multiplication protein IcmE
MNDFKDDDFDNFDDDFSDFDSDSSETWKSNPLLKIFLVVGGVIALIAAVAIFAGGDEDIPSRVGGGLDQSETLGGEISQNYAEVLEEVNQQRLEEAVQSGQSTIPMLINPEETDLLTPTEDLPPMQDFDPLASFRATMQEEAEPEQQQAFTEEPVLIAPEQVFTPQAQPIPAPNPEAVQNLAQAMSANIGEILANHAPGPARIVQVTSMEQPLDATASGSGQGGRLVDTNGDGIPDTPVDDLIGIDSETGEVVIQNVLVSAGTINYGQVLIEANSDVPGPVLVQLVSGPLAGARLIGSFDVVGDLLVLNFNSVVIDGLNQPVSAIALDPNTTLPGIASEVNNRYFKRVILPAAARFLEGVGSAIAQDAETTVTVSGDTVIEETEALDFEQEIGRGVEEAFEEVADFMEDEADATRVLVRVARGTPVGVFFLEPVIEIEDGVQ